MCESDYFQGQPEATELLKTLHNKYPQLYSLPLESTTLVKDTKHWLQNYPKVLEQYNSAFQKLKLEQFERNVLDDMRLSLELLVKELLKTNKSLENCNELLLGELKNKNVSTEVRNMFYKNLEYYEKYQNEHVKHDSTVNSMEIDFIIEQTSSMMKFLIVAIGV